MIIDIPYPSWDLVKPHPSTQTIWRTLFGSWSTRIRKTQQYYDDIDKPIKIPIPHLEEGYGISIDDIVGVQPMTKMIRGD